MVRTKQANLQAFEGKDYDGWPGVSAVWHCVLRTASQQPNKLSIEEDGVPLAMPNGSGMYGLARRRTVQATVGRDSRIDFA